MYIETKRDFWKTGIHAIEKLRPEQWKELTLIERVEVLQRCEDAMAKLEERPRAKVFESNFDDPDLSAIYQRKENLILIRSELLEGKDSNPYVAFGNLVHESRHAYIEYAVTHPEFHKKFQQREEWTEAHKTFEIPKPGNPESWIRYENNPIERTCRLYEKFLSKELKDGHEIGRSKEEFNQELGKTSWRDKETGEVVSIDESGKEVRIPEEKFIELCKQLWKEQENSLLVQINRKQKDDRDKERER